MKASGSDFELWGPQVLVSQVPALVQHLVQEKEKETPLVPSWLQRSQGLTPPTGTSLSLSVSGTTRGAGADCVPSGE